MFPSDGGERAVKELAKGNLQVGSVCAAPQAAVSDPGVRFGEGAPVGFWRLQLLARAIPRPSASFPQLSSSISSLLLSPVIFLPFSQGALLAEFLVVLMPGSQLWLVRCCTREADVSPALVLSFCSRNSASRGNR